MWCWQLALSSMKPEVSTKDGLLSWNIVVMQMTVTVLMTSMKRKNERE